MLGKTATALMALMWLEMSSNGRGKREAKWRMVEAPTYTASENRFAGFVPTLQQLRKRREWFQILSV